MGANIKTNDVYLAPSIQGQEALKGRCRVGGRCGVGKMQSQGKIQSRRMIQRWGEGQGYEKEGWVCGRDGTSEVYLIRDMGRQAVRKSDPCQDCLGSESVVSHQ